MLYLTSTNGRYTLILQRDGNLVLYRVSPRAPLWDSETDGDVATRATLQGDGNFVVYAPDRALWATGTDGERVAYAVLQNDGNFVLYRPNGSAAWATGTNEPPPDQPGVRKEYCCSLYRSGDFLRPEQVFGVNDEDARSNCREAQQFYGADRIEVRKGSC